MLSFFIQPFLLPSHNLLGVKSSIQVSLQMASDRFHEMHDRNQNVPTCIFCVKECHFPGISLKTKYNLWETLDKALACSHGCLFKQHQREC